MQQGYISKGWKESFQCLEKYRVVFPRVGKQKACRIIRLPEVGNITIPTFRRAALRIRLIDMT